MFESLKQFSKLVGNAGHVMPRIQAMKEQLAKAEVEAQSASGRVSVTLTGTGTITRLEIHEALFRDGDRQTVQIEVVETINLALQDAKQLHVQAVKEIVGDLGIPGIDRILAQLAE
jgi:DNA-binding protein YbaB